MVLRELPVPDRVQPRPRSIPSVGGSVSRFPVIVLAVVCLWVVARHRPVAALSVAAFVWFRAGGGRHRRARWDRRPERIEAQDTTTYV